MRLLGYDIQFPLVTRGALATRDSAISDLTNPQEWLIRALAGAAQSATGITVTPLRALGVACVFGCVRVLADSVSSLPLEVHQRQGRGRRLAQDHVLWKILGKKPNDEMTSAAMRWALVANMALHGAAFAHVLRDGTGSPLQVYPIESSRMELWRDPLTKRLRYRLTDDISGTLRLAPANVLHFKGNTFDGVRSLHVTSTVRDCIALALAMQDNASKFFGNGSRPNGVLKHPMSLSKDAQDRLKKQFEDEAGGQNLYRLLLLEEGLEYVATRSENNDSQFNESKDSQNLEICRVFGVPPHKVGITGGMPRANIEEENIGFVMDRIRPICVHLEQEMDTKLFTDAEVDAGYCTYHDLDALQRGNAKARYDSYAVGRQWGILTSNDCREKENLDQVPGGDVLLQPINMIDANKATEYQMLSAKKVKQSEGGNGGKPNANT